MLINFKNLVDKYNLQVRGVLHVGAHLAQEAKCYSETGVKNVVWIEANPYFIDHIRQVANQYGNNYVFNECISDVDGEVVKFNFSDNNGLSSSFLELGHHKIAHPEVNYFESLNLKTKRIDTLFYENNLDINDYNFVTMDIQGAEGRALKGLGQLLNSVDYLFLEVNDKELYLGCMLFNELCEFLKTFDFSFIEREMWGDSGWGDAFFSKNKFLLNG